MATRIRAILPDKSSDLSQDYDVLIRLKKWMEYGPKMSLLLTKQAFRICRALFDGILIFALDCKQPALENSVK